MGGMPGIGESKRLPRGRRCAPSLLKVHHMLLCPECNHALIVGAPSYVCGGCGQTFPAPFGVPILVKGAKLVRVGLPPEELTRDIAKVLAAPVESVRECFSLQVRMPDPGMQVEATQFVDRLRASGCIIGGDAPAPARASFPVNVVAQIDIELRVVVWPDAIEVDAPGSVNVVVTNRGTCELSSTGPTPLYLSYHWYAEGTAIEGHRTKLLIDVPPGRSITVPVQFRGPDKPGRATLEIAPLLETVTWFPRSSVSRTYSVVQNAQAAGFVHDTSQPARTYEDDHRYGIALLREWIGQRHSRHRPSILEIGGNMNPMTADLADEADVWNLDVDAHGLMARNIRGGSGVTSIVADGCNLPFADRSLDVITMFATFHHFPDPVGLLRHLSTKIRGDGLLCLMCEPIGHVTADHDYKAYFEELEKGVNEQSFEVWEYLAMLDAAGLQIVDARFEAGSAKIAARPAASGSA